MKNFFLAIIMMALAGMSFTSCDNSSSPRVNLPDMYYAGKDTTVFDSCQSFVQKEWTGKNSCGNTVSGKSWQPAGFQMNYHTIRQQGSQVSEDSLQSIIRQNGGGVGNKKSSLDWIPDWLQKFFRSLFWLIIIVAAIAATIWLLWKIISAMINSPRQTTKGHGNGSSSTSGKSETESSEERFIACVIPPAPAPLVNIQIEGDNSGPIEVNIGNTNTQTPPVDPHGGTH